jgi:threonyl-tRNA synthetase
LNLKNEKARDVYRHSSSHVMAHAIKALAGYLLAIGPALTKDFIMILIPNIHLPPETLPKCKEMADIINKRLSHLRKEAAQEAIAYFRSIGEIYKVS